jgi:hypothetical protein
LFLATTYGFNFKKFPDFGAEGTTFIKVLIWKLKTYILLSNLSSIGACNWSHLRMMQLLLILIMIWDLLNEISYCSILHACGSCSIILYSVLI